MVSLKVPEEWMAHSRSSVHVHHLTEVRSVLAKADRHVEPAVLSLQPSRQPDLPLQESTAFYLSSPLFSSPQAVNELLQTLDLEKKAVAMGHSQVSGTSFLGHSAHHIRDPDETRCISYLSVHYFCASPFQQTENKASDFLPYFTRP